MRSPSLHTTLVVVALSAGCGNDLDPAWKVKSFRIFGARVENLTTTSPTRLAEAAPGDQMRLTLSWLDPRTPPRAPMVTWVFCAQTSRMGNAFGCDPSNATIAMGATTTYTVPRAMFGTDPTGRARVQALAIVCAGGTVAIDPMTMQPRCQGDDSVGVTMIRSIIVNTRMATDANRNPELTEASIVRTGSTLTPVTLGTETVARVPRCMTDPCPDYTIELRVSPESREMYQTVNLQAAPITQPERLQFGYYVTDGEMELTFYVDTAVRPNGPVRNTWRPPRTAGLVTLVFNVQDVRGGYDSIQRQLMVE